MCFSVLFGDVIREGDRQIEKWGEQCHDISWWLAFLTEEVGELSEAAAETHFRFAPERNIYDEAIQVATLALKIASMVRARNEP